MVAKNANRPHRSGEVFRARSDQYNCQVKKVEGNNAPSDAAAFELEMAQAIASEIDPDGSFIISVMGSLVEKSLISVIRAERKNRYRLLDTTRTYAAAKMTERGESNAVSRRHVYPDE